ncbi:MAG: sulfatase-like hydrolase/transferase, partial [Myxococcales bacterium]|nr:sulfatase-like hydrolase/transferase [Myxococcales bacterium]
LGEWNRASPFFIWPHYYGPHLPRTVKPPFASISDPYRAEIAYADAQFGRLLEGVSRASETREVLIVFTADHGESLGEHGEQTHGILAYDSTLHVPLILSGFGVPSGERTDVFARHADLLPTILRTVGLKVPGALPGRNLIEAAARRDDSEVTGYFESHGPALDLGWAAIEGVRTTRWKYTALPLPHELYDVESDPDETRNLAFEEVEIAAQMRSLHTRLQAARNQRPGESRIDDLDLYEREQLAALGYIDAPSEFAGAEKPDPRRFAAAHGWVDMARGMASRGRYQAAIEILETLVESPSVRPLVLRSLAPVYAEAGRFDDAVRTYRAYIEITDAAEARLGLARTLLRSDHAREALAVLEETPLQSREGQMMRAIALARLGSHSDARAVVDSSFESREDDRLRKRALLVLHAAPVPDGESELRRLLARAQEDPLLRSRLGYYLALWGRSDQREEARAMLEEAARLDPQNLEIQANLGWGTYRLGRAADAVPVLETLLSDERSSHRDGVRLAHALAEIGQEERALDLLRGSLALRPAAPWSEEARVLIQRLGADGIRDEEVKTDS